MPAWFADFLENCLDFSIVLNASITASWLVLAILILRMLLKKAPKWTHVALWGLVALRLLLPFSIESVFSLIPSTETLPQEILQYGPIRHTDPARLDIVTNPAFADTLSVELPQTVERVQWDTVFMGFFWWGGIALMLLYTALTYWRLQRRVSTAVRMRDNIFQSEHIPSPFVLGIFRPRIYLPFTMSGADMSHVIAHEQAHIRRRDHWWKPLGFLLLTFHWFNPVMWLAYILLCRDIELACDEKVIKELGTEQRADYSQALLNCSVHRGMIAACPLAFGEVDVKARVKNVLNYKKPAFWVILLAVVCCLIAALCFLTNPINSSVRNPWVQEYIPGQGNIRGSIDKAFYEDISEDFAIGADAYGRAVFKDPHKAFDTFTQLYADGISLIQNDQGLAPITRNNYKLYKKFGWQMTGGTKEQQAQAAFVTKFLDIYENSFTEEIPMSDANETPVKQVLSLNDVIILSQKGDALTWSDFESYACDDVGSGLYVYSYEINSVFSLEIGGSSLDEKPMYIRLVATATGNYIDIREEDVTAFLQRENSIEETLPDSKMIPLENLSEDYTLEQATIDGCVMIIDGDVRDNQDVWEEFVSATSAKSEAHVRCVEHWYYADASESFTFIFDIFFDGTTYTFRGLLDGEVFERSFRYLLHDFRENEAENPTFDDYSCYHLSNKANSSVIIADIALDGPSIITPDQETYLVYTDLIYYPDHPSIPELEKATLELDGNPLISVVDENVIHKMEVLLSNAEALGYEPKTHNPGATLVLSGSTGESISVILDLESDLCQIDGIFYDYGPGYTDISSINALAELQGLLGLSDWPQAVYEKFADYYAQFTQTPETAPKPNPTFPIEDFLDNGSMVVWYPDWSMVTIAGAQPLAVIEALAFEVLEPVDIAVPAVEDTVYTLHVAYNSGEEYDVFYMGNDTFYLSVSGTEDVYTFVSTGLREAIENAIEKSQ